jgi:hypothetical protein
VLSTYLSQISSHCSLHPQATSSYVREKTRLWGGGREIPVPGRWPHIVSCRWTEQFSGPLPVACINCKSLLASCWVWAMSPQALQTPYLWEHRPPQNLWSFLPRKGQVSGSFVDHTQTLGH